MSSPSQSPASYTGFKSILDDALTEYQKKTKKNLLDYWLATELKSCESIDAVLDILRDQAKAIERTSAADQRLMNRIGSSVNVLSSISDTLGEGINLTFPPAKVIFAGISVLLSAAKGVKASHDALTDLFGRIENFFKRFKVYIESSPTTELSEVLVKVVVGVLSVLSIATREMEQSLTKKYLKKLVGRTDIEDGLTKLDNLIQGEHGMVTAQVLKAASEIKGDVKELSLTIERLHKKAGEDEWKKIRERGRKWIFPPDEPDPSTNHNIACKAYHDGTSTWFFGGSMFEGWMSMGSLLWVHGKPGSGKSILCSTIIRHITALCKPGLAHLAYFYFDFRDEKKQNARNLITSLLSQLSTFSDASCDVITLLYSTHGNGTQKPTDDDLAKCLKQMLFVLAEHPIYIVMDALDECPDDSGWPKTPRMEVLDVVRDLVDAHLPNLRICVTSRPEVDIKSILNQLTIRAVSLHDQSEQQEGMADYISTIMNSDRKMREWPDEDKELVIKELSERADGMFRWVVCQLETLRRSVQRNVRGILSKLPTTLDETYERVLRDIHEDNKEHARRLLHCLAVAARPLLVEELAEILAFDFDVAEGNTPEFHADWRWKNQEEAVLSTCSSLITVVEHENYFRSSTTRVVQFSHFSVKEFLMSNRLATATRDVSRYHILPGPAHTILAQACLGFLLHLDGHVDTQRAKDFPLAKYAAEHWVSHAQFEDIASLVKHGMKDLFDSEKPHFASWVGTHDMDGSQHWGFDQHTRPTPLYYSALCGFHEIAKDLAIKYPQHVNAIGGLYETPLVAAMSRGRVKVAEILLEHGGNPNFLGRDGHTPLLTLLLPNYNNHKDTLVACVRLLLEYGADVNARNNNHETPILLAMRDTTTNISQTPRRLRLGPQKSSFSHHLDDYTLAVQQLLLDYGADVNVRDNNHETLLLLAMRHSTTHIAHFLLDHGADPNLGRYKDETPLHLLLAPQKFGFNYRGVDHTLVFAQLLLERGANVNAQDNFNETPLHLAIQQHHVPDIIRILLEHGADHKLKNAMGDTPLHILLGLQTSYNGFKDHYHSCHDYTLVVARLLLERGADANALDNFHQTPLFLALRHDALSIARLLLENGADPNVENWKGDTPLLELLEHDSDNHNDEDNDVFIARLLLKHGADILPRHMNQVNPLDLAPYHGKGLIAPVLLDHSNTGSESSQTLGRPGFEDRDMGVNVQDQYRAARLRLACYCGRLDIVQELLKHANSENFRGENPLHLLSQGEYDSQVDGVCIARELLERGVDVNAKSKCHRTPLHLASYFGRPAIAQVLLNHGAKPDAEDGHGETPLHLLSRGKYTSQDDGVGVARLLLEYGADVNSRNVEHRTALHHASYNGMVTIAQVLLEHGGTPNAGDRNGESPLHLALRGKDDSEEHCIGITRLLLEHGADVGAQDNYRVTPLELSSRLRKPEITKVLLEYRKTRAGSRKADLSPEVASKRIRLSPSVHFAEVRGENSRDDSMDL